MKSQKPAEGISITYRFEDSVFYKVDCQCGGPDNAIEFEIEIDPSVQEIMVNQFTTQKTDWWTEVVAPRYDIDNEYVQGLNWLWTGLINGLYRRLCLTKNIWWDGYVRYESTTVLSKQQALNYADALRQGIQQLESADRSKKPSSK